ncbi:MAG: hypothetical protein SOZ59_05610 [Candidatus Limivivens sp.]|nr:hypothetical protein [Candidatus Limivivens sp.]
MERIFEVFLISVIAFWAVDVPTKIYLAVIACVLILMLHRYPYEKNPGFYRKAEAVFASNFLVFLFVKYVDGYRVVFDSEDWCCIGYSLLLIGFGLWQRAGGRMPEWWSRTAFRWRNSMLQWREILLQWKERILRKRKKGQDSEEMFSDGKEKEEQKEKQLFRERRFDRDRLREYLAVFPVIGINAPWGSGKSFLMDHLEMEDLIFVKIDLLTCNLDEIQTVLLNELDKVLKDQGIFSSYSPKLKKILNQGGIVQSLGQFLVRDDVTYSEAIAGFRKDLDRIEKKLVIVYEDLDRINEPEVVRKILSISEKIVGEHVQVVHQYDEKNLQEKLGFDRSYLEKYIPVSVNLTDISFSGILDYLFEAAEDEKLPVKREDFHFLELPVWPSGSLGKNFMSVQLKMEIPNVTIRKVEYFWKETILFLEKDGVYRSHMRETILFFLLKYFYEELFQKLIPGKSLLETFLFRYEGKEDTLMNWMGYCRQNSVDIMEIFRQEENEKSALMISLFQYHLDVFEVERKLVEIVNEPVRNLQKKNENEQKDRIVWNLLCNGRSEYTDQKMVIERLQEEVLSKPQEQQKDAYEKLCKDIFHGRCSEKEKGDNKTIFRVAVPGMISLFQANRVAGITGEQWIVFLKFYFQYQKIAEITPELIECLNYCEWKERKTYLYILHAFNRLEIRGNLNAHRSYRTFLDEYLTAFSSLGYVNTEEVWSIRNLDGGEELDPERVRKSVLEPLRKKLAVLKKKIPIEPIKKEIELLLDFLEQNEKLMKAGRKLPIPETNFQSRMESRLPNQQEADRLREVEEEAFPKEAQEAYDKGAITAYEIGWVIDQRASRKA